MFQLIRDNSRVIDIPLFLLAIHKSQQSFNIFRRNVIYDMLFSSQLHDKLIHLLLIKCEGLSWKLLRAGKLRIKFDSFSENMKTIHVQTVALVWKQNENF